MIGEKYPVPLTASTHLYQLVPKELAHCYVDQRINCKRLRTISELESFVTDAVQERKEEESHSDPVDVVVELQDLHLEGRLHDEPRNEELSCLNLLCQCLGPQQRRNRTTTRMSILMTCSTSFSSSMMTTVSTHLFPLPADVSDGLILSPGSSLDRPLAGPRLGPPQLLLLLYLQTETENCHSAALCWLRYHQIKVRVSASGAPTRRLEIFFVFLIPVEERLFVNDKQI